MPSINEYFERTKNGDLEHLWALALEADGNWDKPEDLLKAAETIASFEIDDEPYLLLHVAFILRKGGYLAAANTTLEDLISSDYAPAMCTLGRMHLMEEFIDFDIGLGYSLLERAISLGSLRAKTTKSAMRWRRASGISRWFLFFPAWYWEYRYKFARANGLSDDRVR